MKKLIVISVSAIIIMACLCYVFIPKYLKISSSIDIVLDAKTSEMNLLNIYNKLEKYSNRHNKCLPDTLSDLNVNKDEIRCPLSGQVYTYLGKNHCLSEDQSFIIAYSGKIPNTTNRYVLVSKPIIEYLIKGKHKDFTVFKNECLKTLQSYSSDMVIKIGKIELTQNEARALITKINNNEFDWHALTIWQVDDNNGVMRCLYSINYTRIIVMDENKLYEQIKKTA